MKAWIISDLHVIDLEPFRSDRLLIPDADVCICAGDISNSVELSIKYLARHISPHMPVVAVLGNHDCYGSTIEASLRTAAQHRLNSRVSILENETLVVGDVRIIGATLWTDFEIEHGVADGELPLADRRALAIDYCRRSILDFHAISPSDQYSDGMPGVLTARELIARHTVSREFISSELAEPFPGRTVVLSHHAPSPRSLHPRFKGRPSNAAFASDLSDLIHKTKPDFWIHGHVHHFLDYQEGRTKVLCNPRGYRREWDETGFKTSFVVEV
ncbi:phosphohydrolase [Pseudorhizobium halotolerans]|uniref:Phosphohydrolase n=1 Tax=Pseudorhizobium halotolerans TaxID=1233081 RepID=A0ABN7K198_9HYPH|nr:metallophosphoesterase [Pseudorhizobium halotolerans]CAD7055894.1 phosphohydrolase [Pseudorhizobium halotolerans]